MKRFLAGLCLLALTVGLTAQDKKARTENFLKPIITTDLITLQPMKEFQSFELIVRGVEGVVYQTRINGLQNPFIETYDLNGDYLADGFYAYEIRPTPMLTRTQQDLLQQARMSGDRTQIQALRSSGQLPERLEAQSGYFRIVNGFFVLPTEEPVVRIAAKTDDTGRDGGDRPGNPTGGEEGGTVDAGDDDSDLNNRDQVILDDLIVDGSACIGFDCVNGESFGFDTIRLKENNLRIKFEDTSAAASFPGNDWQLTANDSANGGANKFSIDDISGGRTPFTVEANAPSHSLYVDDGGRLGLGTSIPVADIHVKSGNTPTLRLEQDGTSGFAPQTWDVAGNETNWFVRDATNGSTLPIRLRPGAPSSSIFIDPEGDVGLSTASPDAQLHVIGDGLLVSDADDGAPADGVKYITAIGEDASIWIERDSSTADNTYRIMDLRNNGRVYVRMVDSSRSKTWNWGSEGDFFINDSGDGDTEFRLYENGNLDIHGSLTQNSDVNMKENFQAINPTDVLSKVLDLPLSTWNYIDTEDHVRHLGPMAQDFYAAFGLNGTETGIATLDTSGVALGAIQGLHQVIQEKDARIQELETQVKSLLDQEERIKALEAALLKLK